MNIKNLFKRNKAYLVVSLIFLAYTLFSFGFYYERTLLGNINNHILSSEKFGVPKELASQGIKPRYESKQVSGWDGQFYYYIANDLLGIKDTAQHIDNPPYRYQRVGLALYTVIVSKLLFQSWVSPSVYFFSYLLLLFAATWVGARLFRQVGLHPAWILMWSLSVGTQITLFNALPDAAADAFLILALSLLFNQRILLSTIPFAFSALSREAYTLFPGVLFSFYFFEQLLFTRPIKLHELFNKYRHWQSYYALLIPVCIAVAWHFYVTVHFGFTPTSHVHNIMGAPLVSWAHYFYLNLNLHSLIGLANSTLLFLSLCVLIFSFYIAVNVIQTKCKTHTAMAKGLAATTLILVLLYACFGSTVMMDYTGYIKAISLFLFLSPFILSFGYFSKWIYSILTTLLIVTVLNATFICLRIRILPLANLDPYTNDLYLAPSDPLPCFDEYKSTVEIKKVSVVKQTSFIGKNFGSPRPIVLVDVKVTNTGTYPLTSIRNIGSISMSGQFINEKNEVVLDARRSIFTTPLNPGKSVMLTVAAYPPSQSGHYTLKLSPVQENCSWFYVKSPADTIAPTITFIINNQELYR